MVSNTAGNLVHSKIRRVVVAWSALCFATLANQAVGQIQLDRFFPPVVAAGQESLITAEGKFPSWPVDIDEHRDDIEIRAEEKSGQLKVTVPSDHPPGVVWVRMFDDKSSSKLVPLIVSPIAVTIEKEPNDKRSEASPLELPAVVAGRLAKRDDSDAFRVVVQADQRLVVSVTANQVLQSPMDAVLQVTDLRGNVLMQSDDQRGLDPQLVYQSDRDQDLLIRIMAFPETPNSTIGFSGASGFVYVLETTSGPYLDHVADASDGVQAFGYNLGEDPAVTVSADDKRFPGIATIPGALGWSWILPSEPSGRTIPHGNLEAQAPPVTVVGHIRSPRETHLLPLTVRKGIQYRAEVRSKADGFLLDSVLEVIDRKSGDVLASNDDVSRGGYDAGVEFTSKANGTVDIKLTELLEAFGPRHFYQLTVREKEPSFSLSLKSDRFVLKQNEPLELPVSVTRLNGFDGKIRIQAVDLPAGVTGDPVFSAAKDKTAKSVQLKLRLSEATDGHATFRVIGTEVGEDDVPVEPTREANFSFGPSFSISQFWMTFSGQTETKEK